MEHRENFDPMPRIGNMAVDFKALNHQGKNQVQRVKIHR